MSGADPGAASAHRPSLHRDRALRAARADVTALVRDVPDFPLPGVLFKDITPLLADGPAFRRAVLALDALVPDDVDVVAGVESRGFVLGAALALHRGLGFVPVRKVGKLPSTTVAASYDLEYGSATLEVHADAFVRERSVVVVDDVLATGGTAAASCELVQRAGGRVRRLLVLLELAALGGRGRVTGHDVASVVVL